MPTTSTIEIRHTNLNDLLHDFSKKGTIRIPRFQREYVWEPRRVKDLFDSIYKQFPIGSIFFWIPSVEYASLYKDLPQLKLPPVPKHDKIRLVLDGQQRLTSLYCAAFGLTIQQEGKAERDYKKICFDLDKHEFIVARRGEDKQRLVSVSRFFSDDLEDEIYDSLTQERKASFRECRSILSKYPLSLVEVEEKNLDEAITIFERINQGGKRLNLFDLVVASTWSEDFDLKQKITELNSYFDEKGFGKIEEEIVTQTLALVIKNVCTKSFQLQLTNDEIKNNWDRVSNGLKLAVDFLSENLGVKIGDYLPYPSMLALVAYLFIKVDTRSLTPSQTEFVKDWFWRAAFSQRYGRSALTLLTQDCIEYFEHAVVGENVRVDYVVTISEKEIAGLRMGTRSAVKNAILCLFALNTPRHFKNDNVITLSRSICSEYNNVEKHHIFPRAFLSNHQIKNIHRLANFTFIPGELNREISDTKPSLYFAEYRNINPEFETSVASHLIPVGIDSGVWTDDYEKFIAQRSSLIMIEIKKRIGDMSRIEILIQDNPVGAITSVEKKIRSLIDTSMTEAYGTSYWANVPQGVREKVNIKLQQREKRHPGEQVSLIPEYEKLSFSDITDYQDIILNNWKVFQSRFGSKSEVEKHFLNLKEYRNALAHNREMNNVERKQGEASLEWLSSVVAVSDYIQEEETEADNGDESGLITKDENKDVVVECSNINIRARGLFHGKDLTVLSGSEAEFVETPAFSGHSYKPLRDELILKGILTEKHGKYLFSRDYKFSSPSAAAAVILGRSAAGPMEWKDLDGGSINEFTEHKKIFD